MSPYSYRLYGVCRGLDLNRRLTPSGVSFVAGAAGAGLVNTIGKAQKLGALAKTGAELIGDVAISAGSTAAKGQDVTALGVAADVLGGEALGKARRAQVEASPQQKVRERKADRLKRIGNKPNARRAQQARADNADTVADGPAREAEAIGGVVGGNAAQGGIELIQCGRNRDNC